MNDNTGDVNSKKIATLSVGGVSKDFALLQGTRGMPMIDVSSLSKELGCFTYDPGLVNTAICKSSVCFIDGDKGELLYRGYPIQEVVKLSYLDTAYLLYYSEMPSEESKFRQKVLEHAVIPRSIFNIYQQIPSQFHPMYVLATLTSALSGYCTHYNDPSSISKKAEFFQRTLGQMLMVSKLTFACIMGRQKQVEDALDIDGEHVRLKTDKGTYAGCFLDGLFDDDNTKMSALREHAIEQFLILHADHELNASTCVVRSVGSSLANPIAALVGGICSLSGSAHGGANEAVINMLEQLVQDDQKIDDFLDECKAKKKRLMGFGHRVYKTFDPRGEAFRSICKDVLAHTQTQQKILQCAQDLEKRALSMSYFKDRNLYPNVDFYSGLVLLALGFEKRSFTNFFAMGRTAGWLMHWIEMQDDPQRIVRPRQFYTGA